MPVLHPGVLHKHGASLSLERGNGLCDIRSHTETYTGVVGGEIAVQLTCSDATCLT